MNTSSLRGLLLDLMACVMSCACATGHEASPAAPSTSGSGPTPVHEAMAVLGAAEVFATGPVYEGAMRLPEVDAFASLLAQPHAAVHFQELFRSATTAGRVYALCGLWLTDQASYATASEQLARANVGVEYMRGCHGQWTPVQELIVSAHPGDPDIGGGALPKALEAYAVGLP